MGKLWCFGDSFTAGHGCKPGYEYYDNYPDNVGYIWTEIVAKELQLEEVNLGIPGNSLPNIISQIIENLNNFKKGDYVVLTNTYPFRTLYPNIERSKITELTTDLLIYPDHIGHLPESKQHMESRFKSKADKYDIVSYISSAILPYEKLWLEFYSTQICLLQDHLLSLGIKALYWDYSLWNSPTSYLRFETIHYGTQGTVEDGHWSWQGHKDFAKYLLERINKKQYEYKSPLI